MIFISKVRVYIYFLLDLFFMAAASKYSPPN
jgi:hypothetical protein